MSGRILIADTSSANPFTKLLKIFYNIYSVSIYLPNSSTKKGVAASCSLGASRCLLSESWLGPQGKSDQTYHCRDNILRVVSNLAHNDCVGVA